LPVTKALGPDWDTPTDPLDITLTWDPKDTEDAPSTAKLFTSSLIATLLLPYTAVALTKHPPSKVTDLIVNAWPFTTDIDPSTISPPERI
jgi:hypothetical protein